MCIHLNPRVLKWNEIEFSSISLQYTSTYMNLDEYIRIKQSLIRYLVSTGYLGLVRLADGWWLRLIYCERKILLAGWWLVAGTELV
jgi:hypothetical protein